MVGNKIHKLYCWKIRREVGHPRVSYSSSCWHQQLFFSFSSDLETAWLICFSAVVSWPVSRKISSQVFFYIRWNANSFYTFGGHPFWTFVLEFKKNLWLLLKPVSILQNLFLKKIVQKNYKSFAYECISLSLFEIKVSADQSL